MEHIVFIDKKNAESLRAEIDAKLGYPKDGVNVGGGIHVSVEQGRTLHAYPIVEHPKLQIYAIQIKGHEELTIEKAVLLDEEWVKPIDKQ